jgi:hypothetical protein
MRKAFAFCIGACCYTGMAFSQPGLQSTLQTGMALPIQSDGALASYSGSGVHFGNHLDLLYNNGIFNIGAGIYLGQLSSIGTSDDYKKKGQELARRSGLSPAQLTFNESAFKSTQIMAGPVVGWQKNNWRINIWTKAGYGFNEPGRYAAIYKEGNITANILVSQNGENKNGLALNLGTGIRFNITQQLGLQLAANYFSTQTEQVNYSYDREKGVTPLFYSSNNQYVQASLGLQFDLTGDGNQTKAGISTSRSNIRTKNSAVINDVSAGEMKVARSRSNIQNNRAVNDNANDTRNNDSLFFVPEKIEMRSGPRVTVRGWDPVKLNSVNDYLTAFAWQNGGRAGIGQCSGSAIPGDPIPGLDVRLKRTGSNSNDIITVRTNRDGSFSVNNIEAGNYNAFVGNDTIALVVKRSTGSSNYRPMDIAAGSCNNTKANYVIVVDNKLYAEVTTAREAGSGMATGRVLPTVNKIAIDEPGVAKTAPRDVASGMATGKRMHKPLLVADTDFDLNYNNIIKSDGKLYAEVITAREAGSGIATGKRTLITGDVDGDGLNDYTESSHNISSPRDAASGLATGRRMHRPMTIRIEQDNEGNVNSYEVVSPRDAASGLPTGRRMHKPVTARIEQDDEDNVVNYEVVSPRDAASGLPTGRRMHKPVTIRIEQDEEGNVASYEVVSPRDAASGLPTGKRMHKPITVLIEQDEEGNMVAHEVKSPRDAASGLPTGKRMHKPVTIRIEQDEEGNMVTHEVKSPRDAASGLPTGKRMHKPVTIRIEQDEEGNMVAHEVKSPRDVSSGMATGKRMASGSNEGYQPWDNETEEGIVNNPLYESSGNSGSNPMFESKDALRVNGSNGAQHDIFIPGNLMLKQGNPGELAPFAAYEIGPVKWAAPESTANNKVKAFNQNASRSNHTRLAAAGGPGNVIIKDISRVHCSDGSCIIECIAEVNGNEYEAVVTGVLKTKHDTAKNSIGNIR